jgi:hypothetical protein
MSNEINGIVGTEMALAAAMDVVKTQATVDGKRLLF